MSLNRSPSSENAPLDQSVGPGGVHQHACVLCQQRKVKCDRLHPTCSNCQKGKGDCVYRLPAPPRRRKRKLSEPLLQSRLKKCEQLLERHGIPLGDIVTDSSSAALAAATQSVSGSVDGTNSSSAPFDSPFDAHRKSIGEGVTNLYTKNDLWDELKQVQSHKSSQDPTDDYDDDDDDDTASSTVDVVLGDYAHDGDWLWGASSPRQFELPFPDTQVCQSLWKIHQENVNPVMKIIHVPTVDLLMHRLENTSDEISKNERPLIFSIFATAINSMSNQDCERILGEEKSIVLQRYRLATRQALASAKFLSSSSLVVLQAMVIFLLSLRTDCDASTLWGLSGMALRIGKRLGIHRSGYDEDMPAFEGEMRRRLWFQIAILDAQCAEMVGVGVSWEQVFMDTTIPLNVDDKDLYPDMTVLPPGIEEGVTEMMFTLVRWDFGFAMRQIGLMLTPAESEPTGVDHMAETDLAIDKLEQEFGRKYLRYCDPLNPFHFMVTLTARCMICKARFYAHHPKRYPDRGASMSQEERDKLFMLSLKTIEYESLAHATKSLQGFHWHIRNQVQFSALIYVLSELRERKSGPIVDKAWDQIEEIYGNHPEMIKEKQRQFFWALGSLVVGAWEGREADHRRFYDTELQMPPFIEQLRAQRIKASDTKPTPKSSHPTANVVPSSIYPSGPSPFMVPDGSFAADTMNIYDFSGGFSDQFNMGFDPTGVSPLDWTLWDDMLRDFERQAAQGPTAAAAM